MKLTFRPYYLICLWAMLCCVAACAEQEEPMEQTREASVRVSVAPMQMNGELQTRAWFPLGAERENMIRTLALMVFDSEGQHIIGDSDYYRFIQVAGESAPDGTLTVNGITYPGTVQSGTLCAIGNMTQDSLLTALRRKVEEGGGRNVISLAQFKELTVNLPYITTSRDSVGLMSNIYMFGYYEGELLPQTKEKPIEISMGRIVTRLDVSLSTNIRNDNRLYAIRLRNTSRKAYIFPGERSPEETHTDDYFFPIDLPYNAAAKTLYYYVGPHSAEQEGEATCIDIAYGQVTNDDGTLDLTSKWTDTVSVALCNEPPGTENRNYWLNRNSIYNISIRLVP